MEYRVVGKTGIKVSQLGFGTMTFLAGADEATSRALFDRCREAGINLFDTANIYGNKRDGETEELLGKFMEGQRDECVVITKVGTPRWGHPDNDGGLSRRYIMLEVEKSLRRLRTDRIDFYMLHKMDPDTPMEETLRAMDDLQRQGKILYPAISNAAAWQIGLSLGLSEARKICRFELIEPMYNLVKRQAEVEILPLCQDQKLGVISYSPLGAGLLTGKYSNGHRDAKGRITESARYSGRYGSEENFNIADRFTAFAAEQGYNPSSLAIAWVMSHPAITAPLIGAKNLDQLNTALAALDINMTPELRSEISALSPEPASATDRTEEQKNPKMIGH